MILEVKAERLQPIRRSENLVSSIKIWVRILWKFFEFWLGKNQNQSSRQGSTDRKVGPRGPRDPVRPRNFQDPRTGHGPRIFLNGRPTRTGDPWIPGSRDGTFWIISKDLEITANLSFRNQVFDFLGRPFSKNLKFSKPFSIFETFLETWIIENSACKKFNFYYEIFDNF